MSFGNALRETSCTDIPADGEVLGKRLRRAQSLEPCSALVGGRRADSEMAMHVFGIIPNVDASRRRLRQPNTAAWDNAFGAASGTVGPEARCFGMPERRIRRATAPPGCGSPSPSMLSSLEAIDIDCCNRLRRCSPITHQDDSDLRGRAFFDQIWNADRYAELIGRPMTTPRPVLQELLSLHERLALAWDTEFLRTKDSVDTAPDDASTAASSVNRPSAEDPQPSLRIRRMLESLMPCHGAPEIPLEVVGRLETLVEMEEALRGNKQRLSQALRSPDQHNGLAAAFEPGTPPEILEATAAAAGARQGHEAEAQMPTLLRAAAKLAGVEPGSDLFPKGDLKPSSGPSRPPATPQKSASSHDPASQSSSQLAKEQAALLRRKGFNLSLAKGGWNVMSRLTQL